MIASTAAAFAAAVVLWTLWWLSIRALPHRTWVAETAQGPRFDRFIRIDGPDGQMCAQVHTTWVLIEQATGRPRRVPDGITGMFA